MRTGHGRPQAGRIIVGDRAIVGGRGQRRGEESASGDAGCASASYRVCAHA